MRYDCIILSVLWLLAACAGSKKNEWDHIDYSRIARQNQARENDSNYTPPNVLNCIDDDLYNCRR